MNRQIAFAIAAALAVAGTAYAQTQAAPPQSAPGGVGTSTPGTINPQGTDPSTSTPGTVSPPASSPEPTSPNSASSPRATTGTERSRSPDASAPTRMAAASNVSAGMPVQTVAGEPLGTVRDVVPNASGEPGYVLITKPTGGKTAVPYTTVNAMLRNGAIVLDRARLQGAPQIQDSQLQNPTDTGWQKQADQYWNGRGSMRAAPADGRSRSATPDEG